MRARLALIAHQPADVCVQQAAQAMTAANVRAVRVALLVRVSVMLAVVGDPLDHGALHGHRAERREQVFDRLRGRERAVGQQAMEPDRHTESGDQVHEREDREVGRADLLVPQECHAGEQGEEGDHDGGKVRVALCSGHGQQNGVSDADILDAPARMLRSELVHLAHNDCH